MQKIIDQQKADLEQVEKDFQEVSRKLDETNKLLKKYSFEKKSYEGALLELRGQARILNRYLNMPITTEPQVEVV